jgi:hypothetical protein
MAISMIAMFGTGVVAIGKLRDYWGRLTVPAELWISRLVDWIKIVIRLSSPLARGGNVNRLRNRGHVASQTANRLGRGI